jgi:glyoxylase-like metal-dependent hydrolase (beta-lactamase superfamily II)
VCEILAHILSGIKPFRDTGLHDIGVRLGVVGAARILRGMSKTLTASAILATAIALPLSAQGPGRGRGGQPVQPIQQIKPGLSVIAGAGSNSIVRVTPDGVILVDTKLPGDQNYNDLMTQIRSITNQPVKSVIVTHHHADHTGNNARFLEAGAQVIGHTVLKESLATYQFDPRPAPPSVTYDRDHVVRLGGVTVEVHHYGRSHTGGDSIVYYPDLKVVATSDAVTTGTTGPLIDYPGGSALEWSRVLDMLLKLDFDTAIPGAGPLLTRADVAAFKTKFDTVIDRARALIRKGVAKDQLLMQIKNDDIGWTPRIPQIDAFVAELSK